jgi:hypothetical protein
MRGKIIFLETEIPFDSSNGRKYLIGESYYDKMVELSKFYGNLREERFGRLSVGSSPYTDFPNSVIESVYPTTNFPGFMEVHFSINIPIERIRDIKLKILIND